MLISMLSFIVAASAVVSAEVQTPAPKSRGKAVMDQVAFEREYDRHLASLAQLEGGDADTYKNAEKQFAEFVTGELGKRKILDGWEAIVERTDVVERAGRKIQIAFLNTRDPGRNGMPVALHNLDMRRSEDHMAAEIVALNPGDLIRFEGEIREVGKGAVSRLDEDTVIPAEIFELWMEMLNVKDATLIPYSMAVKSLKIEVIDLDARRRHHWETISAITPMLRPVEESSIQVAALQYKLIGEMESLTPAWWHMMAGGTVTPRGIDAGEFLRAVRTLDPDWQTTGLGEVSSRRHSPLATYDPVEITTALESYPFAQRNNLLVSERLQTRAIPGVPGCWASEDQVPYAPALSYPAEFYDVVDRAQEYCVLLTIRKRDLAEDQMLADLEADLNWCRVAAEYLDDRRWAYEYILKTIQAYNRRF